MKLLNSKLIKLNKFQIDSKNLKYYKVEKSSCENHQNLPANKKSKKHKITKYIKKQSNLSFLFLLFSFFSIFDF